MYCQVNNITIYNVAKCCFLFINWKLKELRPMKKLGRVFEEYLLTESSTDRSSSEKPTMTGSLVVDPFLEMGGVKRSHYEYLGSLTTPGESLKSL